MTTIPESAIEAARDALLDFVETTDTIEMDHVAATLAVRRLLPAALPHLTHGPQAEGEVRHGRLDQ